MQCFLCIPSLSNQKTRKIGDVMKNEINKKLDDELKKSIRKDRRRKARAEKIADSMIKCLGKRPDKYMLHMILPKILGRKMLGLFSYDTYDINNPLIDGMMDEYVKHHVCPMLTKWIQKIWKNQKKKSDWYGDIDHSFKKYRDTDAYRVSVIDDYATTSDENKYVIIEDKSRFRIHIRNIVEKNKSDYPRKRHPEKLGLRFYRDRDFNMNYDEKHHMTNLGGVYGDERDQGYVISYDTKYDFLNIKGTLMFRKRINHVMYLLGCMSRGKQ